MKRFASLLLTIILLASMTTALAAAGSSSDPLISKSYADAQVDSMISQYTSGMSNTFAAKNSNSMRILAAIFDSAKVSRGMFTDYTLAKSFTPFTLTGAGTVSLLTGASIVVKSGSVTANIARGELINVTMGTEVTTGASLVAGQRYLCAENTMVIFTAGSASSVSVDGYYKLTGVLAAMPFTDVTSSDWYYDAVRYVYERGYFNGVTETGFEPNGEMTRAMFVTALYRLAGEPDGDYACPFDDVESGMWYYTPVAWAYENNVVSGYSDTEFRPDTSITREQLAVIMYNYASIAGISTTASSDRFSSFADGAGCSSWARDALVWATDNYIINGSDDGLIHPLDTATRAQVAQIIKNSCEQIPELA